VRDAALVELRAGALRDHVDAVVLKVLRDARHERDADVRKQQQEHAAHEHIARQLIRFHGVAVDDQAEDLRIEKREDLIDRREHERRQDQSLVAEEVRVKKTHFT
jgi:hypothetical protein